MKKMISLILALVMLLGMTLCAPVSAEGETLLISEEILNQVAEETDPDYMNLSFIVRANVSGMKAKTDIGGTADYTNATVEYNGQIAKVIEMGVMVTNNIDLCANVEDLTLDAANQEDVVRVVVENLYEAPTEDACVYAARIRNIPYYGRARELVARPYFILENDEVVYSDVDRESYLDVWGRVRNPEMPADPIDLDKGVMLESVTYDYALDAEDAHNVLMSATFTVNNGSGCCVVDGSFMEYACYDENGEVLQQVQIDLKGIAADETVAFTESVPVETMKIACVDSNVTLLTLPAIGSDIDVVKKKNRIRVSAAEASFNEDGTIHVALTFTNYTSNWITEETDYVQYTYYDAAGTKIKTATIYIGCIDTKKNKVKTFEFDVPANTAKVAFTNSKIVYWTEWS